MSGDAQGRWRATWLRLSLLGALGVTLLDAVLLQLRRSYFTGGFLAVDHVATVWQAAGFAASSILADTVVVGAGVAAGLWLASRLRLTRWTALSFAVAIATAPILLANFIEYELLTYLGDAFDLRLMFDLAGRQVSEVFAVASAHLWNLVLTATAVGLVLGAVVWLTRRRLARLRASTPAFAVSALPAALLAVTLLAVGALGTAWARSVSDVLDNGLRRKPTGRLLGTIVTAGSDFDRDGFGLLGRPPDPDLFDARVRPYALDTPGNGIDENGVGGDLPAGTAPYVEPVLPQGPWRATPHIVVIVLESFRADALGKIIEGTPVTPTLDAIAARGVNVRHAYSHNGYTVQSRRHIFSGSVADLPRDTLVDDFNAQGYQTAYFSAQDESFGGAAQGVGFDRAQVHYDARDDRARRYSSFTTAGSLAVSHDVLNARIAEFLATKRTTKPLFLYVNYHDTHFPYRHRTIESIVSDTTVAQADIAPGQAEPLRTMYFNTAANVDRAIATMLDHVRRTLGAEPGIIVLSDHGESLYDEGFLGHGYALNDVQTRIPLIAANLPITLPEPFGQADLRRVLHEGLGAHPAGAPTVQPRPDRSVFQYLGNIDRPAQIAFTDSSGRLVYDLRARQASHDGVTWMRDADLDSKTRSEVQRLIHTWEQMLHARAARER